MQEPFSLVAERLSDLAVLIIAIATVALLVLETIFLAALALFVTTRQAAHGRDDATGVPGAACPSLERYGVVPHSTPGAP